VRDYEVLRKELPDDKEVAENLFHAQVALKTSRGEEVSNMKFGGDVDEITGVEQFQAAISLTGEFHVVNSYLDFCQLVLILLVVCSCSVFLLLSTNNQYRLHVHTVTV